MATLSLPKNVVPEIVQAREEDIERMAIFGQAFWEQTRYFKDGIGYDWETVADMTHTIIEEGVALYAEEAGELVGLLLVFVSPHPMNKNQLLAVEWVFYVEPNYRRSGLGKSLILTAESLLQNRGVRHFTMVSLSDVTPEAANRLYESMGFAPYESSFMKTIPWR